MFSISYNYIVMNYYKIIMILKQPAFICITENSNYNNLLWIWIIHINQSLSLWKPFGTSTFKLGYIFSFFILLSFPSVFLCPTQFLCLCSAFLFPHSSPLILHWFSFPHCFPNQSVCSLSSLHTSNCMMVFSLTSMSLVVMECSLLQVS